MVELINFLIDSGRRGGVAMLVLGLAMLAVTAYYVQATGLILTWVLAVGGLLVVLGVLLAIFGNPAAEKVELPDPAPLTPELIEDIKTRKRPYFLCTRCRHVTSMPVCDLCFREVDCMDVRDAADVPLALAAIE